MQSQRWIDYNAANISSAKLHLRLLLPMATSFSPLFDRFLLVRGAGDLASGVLYRLHVAGFAVAATELPQPLVVRRTVAFAQAVYDGAFTVEGVTATRVEAAAAARQLALAGGLPILPDPGDAVISQLRPAVLVDARLRKRGGSASRDQAALVIGLGPGFTAGEDCHAVVETNRGHDLGRVYWQGSAQPNTGAPAPVAGYAQERVLRAPASGRFWPQVDFGDQVGVGDVVGVVEQDGMRTPVQAAAPGMIRGLLYPGLTVWPGMKIGDIEPRVQPEFLHTISDKALAIGGAVLTAILSWLAGSSNQ